MASEESRYQVELNLYVRELGKDELPMSKSENQWNGLNYEGLVAFEAEMMDAVTGALKKLGLGGIELLKATTEEAAKGAGAKK